MPAIGRRKIRLRACIRIGEISRDLETSKGGANPQATLPSDWKSKSETLAEAGIATSTAHDYEHLAGGKEKQAQDVGEAAAAGAPPGRRPAMQTPGRPHGRFDWAPRPLTLAGEPEPAGGAVPAASGRLWVGRRIAGR